MARKAVIRPNDLGRRSPSGTTRPAVARVEPRSATELALLVVLGLDAALSLVMLYIHAQLHATGGTYTSFCNVSNRVNCDAVLGSQYALLGGFPVALWALATYVALAGLVAWRGRAPTPTRGRLTLLMVAVAAWIFVFSLYMGALAVWALGTICLLCAGMYVLNATIAVLAWQLARREPADPGSRLTRARALTGAGAIAVALAAAAAVQLGGASVSGARLTPADVQSRDPEFYRWYTTRPKIEDLPPPVHVKGGDDAAVTIVEFSDFECGYCAKAFHDLRELERAHGGNIKIVFHHFPLDSDCNPQVPARMHKSACLAAIAAECAARFDRFWDYHDRLFNAQDRLGRDALVETATGLGIDRDRFSACLDDPAARARVTADAAAGAKLGVKSTPTLFINGREVEGALDRDAYEYVIAMERHG